MVILTLQCTVVTINATSKAYRRFILADVLQFFVILVSINIGKIGFLIGNYNFAILCRSIGIVCSKLPIASNVK